MTDDRFRAESGIRNPKSIVVVGAGPGGYPAAFRAADLGMDVTLIDGEANPGGVCLFRGCIPSKTLLHAAAIVREAAAAADWGIDLGSPRINIDKLRARKESIVDKLTGGLGQLCKARKIRFLRGHAELQDASSLKLTAPDGREERIAFDAAIVATGSEPVTLPFVPDSPRVMDSTGALALEEIPGTLLVVGGGYIGLELGQVYAALGARVSVVEMMPALLPGADADLVAVLAARLKKQFDSIRLETKVEAMQDAPDGVRVTFRDKQGAVETLAFDKVLIAVGRRPVTAGCGLENTRVRVGAGGFIEVDAQRRTAEPTLFAVGDCAGQPMLAHKATHEARVAADAMAGRKTVYDVKAVPAVVFTDPEIAWCGVSESDAARDGRDVRVATFPWAASGRAATLGRADGITKLVLDPGSNRVLGLGLAGPGAGELISEGVLAVEMGAVAEDLVLSIHPHPTLSETIMEAAEAAEGRSTHFIAKR